MEKNYYEILEVDIKASKEIIEKAYKVLAKRYHPDTQSENKKEWANDKLKEINEAYEILSDENTRKKYDIELDYDKNGVIEALCAKNEHLQHLVDELQKELEYAKKQNDINNHLNNYTSYKNISYTIPNQTFTYRNMQQNEPVFYEEKKFYVKNKLKDFLAFVFTILCIISIGFLLWKIPFTHTFLINLYENNQPIKSIINLFIK